MSNSCYSCGTKEKDLRPYGPNCSMVCFDCAFSTPEKEAETNKNFEQQFNKAFEFDNIVIIGSEAGPYPYRNRQ